MSLSVEKPSEFTRPPHATLDGVPSFVKEDYFYREVDRQTILNIISLAKTIGWKSVTTSITNTVVKRYISDPIRTLFLELVRIPPGSKVLDLGAGWGSLSMQIAKRYHGVDVFAFDKTLEGLLFLDVVKNQEKLSNIHIAHVDASDIPMADESFDIALIIGVLEWTGESVKDSSPVEAQLKVLQEVRRLLRKGGKAVIGIENRFSYEYLRGKRDHSGMRFASVFPKSLTNAYMKTRYRREYRTYIYSHSGYQNLFLGRAGFTAMETFVTSPSYRFPKAISDPINVRKMMVASHRKNDQRWIRLLPDSILRRVVPSFYFIVEK
jgi:ubiquinone/menaquinone biosynthesis C-methylase UbiE